MGTQPSSPRKGAEPHSPIFGPLLLRPNGSMHQDGTWYGSIPPSPGTAAIRRRCQSMKPQAEDRRQVDEPLTRRRLRSVPPPRPLRPLTGRLNAFCSIASTYICARSCLLGVAVIATTLKFLVALIFGRPFVKRFALCYRYVVLSCAVLSVCLSVLSVYL